VADEIRKLAETSAEQSTKINADLSAVMASIEAIARDNSRTMEAFERTSAAATDIERVIADLNGFVARFGTVSRQVQDSMRTMEQINGMVYQGSNEMRQGNGEILTATTLLRNVSRDVLEAVREISAQTKLIAEASESLLHSNEKTDTVVGAIRELVGSVRTSEG
jgi:methyl-accepting chemotaxis protein